MALLPKIYVDWDNDGTYVDAGEEVTTRVLMMEASVTAERGRDQLRSFSPPRAGQANATLDNESKDYSTDYTLGPLYGLLLPGRRVRFDADNAGAATRIWTGVLEDLPQHPEIELKTVELVCLGRFSQLTGESSPIRISTALYQNVRIDECMAVVFDAVGITDYVLDTAKTTLAWWWLDNEDPFGALRSLLASEGPGSALYEDGQGRPVFESRHYRLLTARSATSQATFADTGTEPYRLATLNHNPGQKDVANSIALTYRARAAQALAVVWSLGSTLSLAPNEARSVTVTSTDPFTAAVTPVNATDYTVSAGSLSSVSLDRTSGARVTITLTAGASGATVTGLQLRAQPVTVTSEVVVPQTIDVSASVAKYGTRPYNPPDEPRAEFADLNTMQDMANAIAGAYQNPRPTGTVSIEAVTAATIAQFVAREISDRITVVDAQTGLNSGAHVEQLKYEWDRYVPRLHMGYEKADESSFLILDSPTAGILDTNQLGF